jgi:hypothetical protein
MDLGHIGWDGLAQDRDRWGALVNSVMNLWVHKMLGSSLVAAQMVASRVVHSSTVLVTDLPEDYVTYISRV